MVYMNTRSFDSITEQQLWQRGIDLKKIHASHHLQTYALHISNTNNILIPHAISFLKYDTLSEGVTLKP